MSAKLGFSVKGDFGFLTAPNAGNLVGAGWMAATKRVVRQTHKAWLLSDGCFQARRLNNGATTTPRPFRPRVFCDSLRPEVAFAPLTHRRPQVAQALACTLLHPDHVQVKRTLCRSNI